ncbi:MAG: hypothetical protein ACRD4P_04725 [Bryobacteraceae bacterium]
MNLLVLRADGYRCRHIEAHLVRCAGCRRDAERLVAACRVENHEAHLLDEIFENLQVRMQAWCSLGGLPGGHQFLGVRRRKAAEDLVDAIELYFGKEAARRIACSAGWDVPDRRLIPVAKPLFSAFLGKRAADALASRIANATT